ncbi:MAG: site-specific DNA-methyltransferase, partial [Rikenellaceae bacterium]
MNKLKMHSLNKVDKNIEAIGAMFPNCLTERKGENGEVEMAIDFDVLRQELSSVVVEGAQERYQFTWPEKRKSMLLANAPIAKTLRPCREESRDFDTTENLYIEGDNLDVLKLLQETYLGKVKMIYIDPPYNTGNDFVYEDDFAMDSDEWSMISGDYEDGSRMVKNLDSNGRFHTDWLNMIYPRLKVARDLLTEDGVIFISIDYNEVENLKKICDEVFGVGNYGGTIIWKKKTNGNNVGIIPPVHDYILVYTKNIALVCDIGFLNNNTSNYSNPDNDPRGVWTTMDLSANHKGPYFGITNPKTGEVHYPSDGRYWVFNEKDVLKRIEEGRIIFGKSGNAKPVQRVFLSERGISKRKAESWWDKHGMNEDATLELSELFGIAKIFSHPKPVKLIYNLCSIVLEKDDIMLDFFSGSGTSAHAVMELNALDLGNRKCISIQLPENIDDALKSADTTNKAYLENSINFLDSIGKPHFITEIGKERIRRAGDKVVEDSKGKDLFATDTKLDTGFRVLKLDSTNMKDVYYNPQDYSAEIFAELESNIKEDRTPEDLLFQVMLDLGVLLSANIEESEIAGKKVFNVNDGYLIACFDDNVTEETVTAIAKLQPYYFAMRDSSMATDSVATNFE